MFTFRKCLLYEEDICTNCKIKIHKWMMIFYTKTCSLNVKMYTWRDHVCLKTPSNTIEWLRFLIGLADDMYIALLYVVCLYHFVPPMHGIAVSFIQSELQSLWKICLFVMPENIVNTTMILKYLKRMTISEFAQNMA